MVRGDQLDQLRLSEVGVLELVYEHVPEAALELDPCGGRIAEQPQRQADLVAEVDQARAAEELLISRVGSGELELLPRASNRPGPRRRVARPRPRRRPLRGPTAASRAAVRPPAPWRSEGSDPGRRPRPCTG